MQLLASASERPVPRGATPSGLLLLHGGIARAAETEQQWPHLAPEHGLYPALPYLLPHGLHRVADAPVGVLRGVPFGGRQRRAALALVAARAVAQGTCERRGAEAEGGEGEAEAARGDDRGRRGTAPAPHHDNQCGRFDPLWGPNDSASMHVTGVW